MFRSRYLLLALTILCACGKNDGPAPDDTPGDDNPAVITGTPTAKGESDGSEATQGLIGPDGGSLASTDGKLTVTFPPGALTARTLIMIGRITNQNPLKVGHAYRLTPHGTTFAKPVTLTFKYHHSDSLAYPMEAARVACQDRKGVWQAIPNAVINAAEKTVSVQTTHFSDWSQFAAIRIAVKQPALAPGAATPVELLLADDFLAP